MLVRLLLRFAKYLGWWLLGFLGGLLVLSFIWAQGLPDLQFWHQRSVVDEYVLELDDLEGSTIEEYLEHEDEIFTAMASLLVERERRKHATHP